MINNKQCGICADCAPQIGGGSGFNNCEEAYAAMNNEPTDDRISNATLIRLILWADQHNSQYVAAALRELQERRKSFRWISIDEELPEDESTVIVKNIDGVQWVADFNDDYFYPDEFPVYKMGGDEITHWMRFPE